MSKPCTILALESSCDETACAVVSDGRDVRSSVVASQIEMHARYGGVVPELASRAHLQAVNTVIEQALDQAGTPLADIDAVAATCEPGLIGCLLTGLMAAKTLAWTCDLPLVAVNHVHAHVYASALDDDPIEYPAGALICSGGHTALYHVKGPMDLTLLGSTIDDAAGEAYDKVASILNLGYPGGPVIDRVSREGNPKAVDFPRTLLKGQSLDFSFSGIKTAVLYHVNGVPGLVRDKIDRPLGIENLSEQQMRDIAASFQAAVVDVLRIKLRRAAAATGARTLILGGGVAANTALRTAAGKLAEDLGATLRMPPLKYCVDNAAMIGGLAYHLLQAGKTASLDIEARPTVRR